MVLSPHTFPVIINKLETSLIHNKDESNDVTIKQSQHIAVKEKLGVVINKMKNQGQNKLLLSHHLSPSTNVFERFMGFDNKANITKEELSLVKTTAVSLNHVVDDNTVSITTMEAMQQALTTKAAVFEKERKSLLLKHQKKLHQLKKLFNLILSIRKLVLEAIKAVISCAT